MLIRIRQNEWGSNRLRITASLIIKPCSTGEEEGVADCPEGGVHQKEVRSQGKNCSEEQTSVPVLFLCGIVHCYLDYKNPDVSLLAVTSKQCCESGYGRIRNFLSDPDLELFVSDPDSARRKDQINIYR